MIKNKTAFTLVELIVVITIVGILSTVGFVAYTDYLKGVRDSSRVQQMSEIYKALTLYGIKSKLPVPSDSVTVSSGLNSIGSQGYADQGVLDTIKYSDGGKDPKTKNDYTYFMSSDRKYAQILGFFEDNITRDLLTMNDVIANETDYSTLHPQVLGSELGVLLESGTNIPIQELSTYIVPGSLDILTATGSFISYATNTKISEGEGSSLIGMVPRLNCKKILDILGSANSGTYKINMDGDKQIEVYCDMDTDDGGWTFAGFIDNQSIGNEISFTSSVGSYSLDRLDTSETYSLNMSSLKHKELLWVYDSDISVANASNKLVHLRYDIGFPGFYSPGMITPCSNFFGDEGKIEYRTSLSDNFLISTRPDCSSTSWGFRPTDNSSLILRVDNTLDGAGIGKGAYYDSRTWGIQSGDPGYMRDWRSDVWIYVR